MIKAEFSGDDAGVGLSACRRIAAMAAAFAFLGCLAAASGAVAQPASVGGFAAPRGGDDETLIVGGKPADIAEHPWQVALSIETLAGGPALCGGSVIAPQWIVTAAHCFVTSPRDRPGELRFGATRLGEGGEITDFEAVVIHPSYDRRTQVADIALVKVEADLSDRVIRLTGPEDRIRLGAPLEVSGWGRTSEGGQVSQVLMRADVPLVGLSKCNAPDAYDGAVREGMMCAGHIDGGIDACQGDSGGPLVWRGGESPALVGVVSWGEGCARALRYGVYTQIRRYKRWILTTIAEDG
ncbi:MAG: serine protease [Pseudomonadota bacterium]